MLDLLAIAALSLGLSLCLTPLARAAAHSWGLVDRPDGRRKLHSRAVAVAGGLPLLLSASLPLIGTFLVPGSILASSTGEWPRLGGLLLASVVICAVGIADDLGRLRGRHKIAGQLLAVAIVIVSGVQVHTIRLFDRPFDLGPLWAPFTAFLLLGAINSLNLIDGMDGLLSSVGFIICMAMGAMALVGGHLVTVCISLALAGALLGFLRYNYPPATIFLGDSGSMLIGLVVGVLAIQSSLKGPATAALAAPTALLILPIFDTTAAILRRKLTGRSIYTTDRGHLHHCLLRRGLTAPRVLLLVAGFCLLTVVGALASVALNNELLALLSAAAVVGILVAWRLFGYAELSLLRQRLQSLLTSFLHGPAPREAREIAVRLQGSVDWQELWLRIMGCGPRLNLRQVKLDVNAPAIDEGYHARWDRAHDQDGEDAAVWRAEIPLSAQGRTIGRLEVIGDGDDESVWEKMAVLAELVQDFETSATRLTNGAWEALAEGQPGPHAFRGQRVRAR